MHRPPTSRATLDSAELAILYVTWMRPVAFLAACLAMLVHGVSSASAGSGEYVAAGVCFVLGVALAPPTVWFARRYGSIRIARLTLLVDLLATVAVLHVLQDDGRLTMAFFWPMLFAALLLSWRASMVITTTVVLSIALLADEHGRDGIGPETLMQLVFVALLGSGVTWLRFHERQTRMELVGAQAQLRFAQRLAHLGSWEWDPLTRRSYWSDEVRRMFGLPMDAPEVLQTFLDRIIPEERDAATLIVEQARAAGTDYQFDATIERLDDGERRIIEVIGTPAPARRADDLPRYYGSVQDVTEARRLDRMKSEFVATASHELRTPAAIIIGFASTLRQRWEDLSNGQRVAFVGEIERAGARLNQLIEDVLQVTRIENGQIRCEHEPFDLLDEVRSLLAHWPTTPQPPLELDVPEEFARDAVTVVGDSGRTMQVVTNLLSNAEAHTPKGTSVRVVLSVSAQEVRVEVIDDGPGVPFDARDRIFERFVRLDSREQGTGLGLYISRKLMEAQGGSLELAPPVSGEGAHFVVTLPRYADTRQSTSSSTSSG